MLVVVAITVETHFSRFSGVVRAPESRLIVAAMLDLQNLRELVLKSKMAATAFTQPKKKKNVPTLHALETVTNDAKRVNWMFISVCRGNNPKKLIMIFLDLLRISRSYFVFRFTCTSSNVICCLLWKTASFSG